MNATATDFKPPRQRTSEETRVLAKQRVIANARKPVKRTSPKLSSPLPKAHTPKAPVLNSVTIPSRLAPAFSEQTLKRFDMAVKALKGTRSLSERLTIAACHLRSDPALAGIDPRELLKELNSQNK
jgi:hypothetical protein